MRPADGAQGAGVIVAEAGVSPALGRNLLFATGTSRHAGWISADSAYLLALCHTKGLADSPPVRTIGRC